MKKKVVSLILVILLMGLILPGCVSKAEMDECESLVADQAAQIEDQAGQIEEQAAKIAKQEDQLAEKQAQLSELLVQIGELENQVAEQPAQIQEFEAQIAELEEEIAALEAEIESLREPGLQLDVPWVVGTINFDKTIEILKEFFPESFRETEAYTRGPYQLVDLETLERFLATDRTNFPCRAISFDACDTLAFRLKNSWIEAGIPPWSLGLIKGKRMTSFGEIWCWRNVFLTIENGEYVFYEVVPSTKEIIKIEEPYSEPHFVRMSDSL